MKPLKEKISITIDNDVLAKLKEKAEYDDRSLSQYINIVLKKHLKDIENKDKSWTSQLLLFHIFMLMQAHRLLIMENFVSRSVIS